MKNPRSTENMQRRRKARARVRAVAAGAIAAAAGQGLAAPHGEQIREGQVTIQRTGTRTDIRQTSTRAIVDWTSFDARAGEQVQFFQPDNQAIILNRVTGRQATVFEGSLTANGRVVLVNPYGVLIGAGARVDVGGLLVSTANVSNVNFMSGVFRFDEPGKPDATIVNRGMITAAEGGFAALVAPHLRNSGQIEVRLGKIALAGANRFTVDLYGDNLVSIAIADPVGSAMRDVEGRDVRSLVDQSGQLTAPGGRVALLSVGASREVIDNLIDMSGTIRANTIGGHNGQVSLVGSRSNGTVRVSGVVEARGESPGTSGGSVTLLAEETRLESVAKIDASGVGGGGTVNVGRGMGLNGKPATAQSAWIEAGARIDVRATEEGNGGSASVVSAEATVFRGGIDASGGRLAGNGGTVRVPGRANLVYEGSANVTAPAGRPGTLVLDPHDVVIERTAARLIGEQLRGGVDQWIDAGRNVIIRHRVDGTGGAGGAGLRLTAGNDIWIRNDVLVNGGPLSVHAYGGRVIMEQQPVPIMSGRDWPALFAGSGNIDLRAGDDVRTAHLITRGHVAIASDNGNVTSRTTLGHDLDGRYPLASLTVRALGQPDSRERGNVAGIYDVRVAPGGSIDIHASRNIVLSAVPGAAEEQYRPGIVEARSGTAGRTLRLRSDRLFDSSDPDPAAQEGVITPTSQYWRGQNSARIFANGPAQEARWDIATLRPEGSGAGAQPPGPVTDLGLDERGAGTAQPGRPDLAFVVGHTAMATTHDTEDASALQESGGRGVAIDGDLGRRRATETPEDVFGAPKHVAQAPVCISESPVQAAYFAQTPFGISTGQVCRE